jgi:hypothetical protein
VDSELWRELWLFQSSIEEDSMNRAVLGAAVWVAFGVGAANAATVSFTELTGLTGGSPAATGVFRADLSGLSIGDIKSITIQDNSSPAAGAPGQFSGFDLDAVIVSSTLITDASQVASLVRIATLDFAGSALSPGVQTPPVDPALFGTTGGHVDLAVATLDSFDGNSTTAIPGAFGFVSLGVGGKLGINLTSPLAVGPNEFLYIGEVGNNGEVAASTIDISSTQVGTPEPSTWVMMGLGFAGLGLAGWRNRRKTAGHAI